MGAHKDRVKEVLDAAEEQWKMLNNAKANKRERRKIRKAGGMKITQRGKRVITDYSGSIYGYVHQYGRGGNSMRGQYGIPKKKYVGKVSTSSGSPVPIRNMEGLMAIKGGDNEQ